MELLNQIYMYGKKRIVITKDRQVVLAGGRSWIPIGRYNLEDGFLVGRLRKPDSWETSLNNDSERGAGGGKQNIS